MLSDSIRRLRAVSFLEGLSYLFLLFVAMPLKYIWGDLETVRTVGMAHGILFVVFCLTLALGGSSGKLTLKDQALIFVLSLVPFGFVFIDRKLAPLSKSA